MEKEAFRDKLMERGALIALVTHAWNGHNRWIVITQIDHCLTVKKDHYCIPFDTVMVHCHFACVLQQGVEGEERGLHLVLCICPISLYLRLAARNWQKRSVTTFCTLSLSSITLLVSCSKELTVKKGDYLLYFVSVHCHFTCVLQQGVDGEEGWLPGGAEQWQEVVAV